MEKNILKGLGIALGLFLAHQILSFMFVHELLFIQVVLSLTICAFIIGMLDGEDEPFWIGVICGFPIVLTLSMLCDMSWLWGCSLSGQAPAYWIPSAVFYEFVLYTFFRTCQLTYVLIQGQKGPSAVRKIDQTLSWAIAFVLFVAVFLWMKFA